MLENMKRLNNILHNWHAAAFALLTATLAACTADPIEMEVGSGAAFDPVGMGEIGFHSPLANADTLVAVNVKPGEKFKDVISLGFVKELSEDVKVSLTLEDDEDWLKSYNENLKLYDIGSPTDRWRCLWALRYFPTEKITIPTGEMTIPAGSYGIELPLVVDCNDRNPEYYRFLMMLKATITDASGETTTCRIRYHLFFDAIADQHPQERLEGHGGSKFNFVTAYLDPNWLDPRACLEISLSDGINGLYYDMFDAETLIGGMVSYDIVTRMPVLKFDRNLLHVLRNRERYLKPVQDDGIKVMIAISGSGLGIGFCNLDDAQRASLVKQIQEAVNRYGLDGVNLDDENSGYGREGMPAIAPASYAKFIRDLRTALGQDKLITLTDVGEPSATLYQTHGGIAAGEYLDYAWTGMGWTFADPYQEGTGTIAGLPREKYGRFTFRSKDMNVDVKLLSQKYDELITISETDDPRICAFEILPAIEGAESQSSFMYPYNIVLNVTPYDDDNLWETNDGNLIKGWSAPHSHDMLAYANMLYYPDWLRF